MNRHFAAGVVWMWFARPAAGSGSIVMVKAPSSARTMSRSIKSAICSPMLSIPGIESISS